ncbi:MAG: hypothetical protein LBQ32_04700 [Burkholderiaceae bacterium]|nr:hypothetical protein [Burkholderiaceae bacterium]
MSLVPLPYAGGTAGFDLIWFGILMTIVMETGLIHPSSTSSCRTVCTVCGSFSRLRIFLEPL